MYGVTPALRASSRSGRRQRRGQGHWEDDPAERLRRGTRPVRRQLQHGRRTRERAPSSHARWAVQRFTLEPLPLPVREVRVLHRQRRQPGAPRRASARGRACSARSPSSSQRNGVADDVVRDEEQHLVLRPPRAAASRAPAGPRSKSKGRRASCLARAARPPRLPLGPGRGSSFSTDTGERQLRGGALNGLAIHLGEGRPQRLVPLDDVRQGAAQRGHVQHAHQAQILGAWLRGAPASLTPKLKTWPFIVVTWARTSPLADAPVPA